MYLFEPFVFLAVSLIFCAFAMENRSVLFSLIATVAPLWELGQVASSGYSNFVVGVAYDPNTATFHNLVQATPYWVLVLLALAVVAGATISISLSISGKKAPD